MLHCAYRVEDMKQDFFEQFRSLTTKDKLDLLYRLWDEVAEELASRPATEAEQRFLEQRLRDIDTDQRPTRTWDEIGSDLFADR